jgi:hypothetical protein
VPCGANTSDTARWDWKRSCKAQGCTDDRSRPSSRSDGLQLGGAFEKLQSHTPVQRRAAAARALTRVEVLREVVVQDRVADRAALQAPTSTLAEAVEKLRRLQARCEQSRTMAAHARGPKGQKAANAKLGGIRRAASPQPRGPQSAHVAVATVQNLPNPCGLLRQLQEPHAISSPPTIPLPLRAPGSAREAQRFERGTRGRVKGEGGHQRHKPNPILHLVAGLVYRPYSYPDREVPKLPPGLMGSVSAIGGHSPLKPISLWLRFSNTFACDLPWGGRVDHSTQGRLSWP